MVVYFYSQNQDEIGKHIFQHLRKAQVDVFSNLSTTKPADTSLNTADALLIHSTTLDEESSYFVALAMSENKPVLFLTDSRGIKSKTLKTLKNNKNFSDKMEIKQCDLQSIDDLILNFLQKLDQNSVRDMVNIKYTLRLSPKMSDYLDWKSKQIAIRKADWLRNLINKSIEGDKEYQKFLNTKYKVQ
ncbi:hypothetical protein HOD19_01835 [bacterium]|jgi:hypothetical protein|nr:hypothetical protein [bacterium]MBT4649531.1 hypothetical protein [bacterium]